MKTPLIAVIAAAFAGLAAPCSASAELKVHEWGTLTVLQGSDGIPLRWYLPLGDQQALPAFVHHSMSGTKAGIGAGGFDGALVRMETPVLYFYPQEEMNISVTASLVSGRLSEWFPNALTPSETATTSLQWVGRLLSPSSPLATRIPHADDAAGRHYDAARAVPDAWLFQSALPMVAGSANVPAPQIDRLIFYRGAADLSLPLNVQTLDDQTFTVTTVKEQPMPAILAVQASEQGIAWTRLEQPASSPSGPNTRPQTFAFPKAVPRETAIPALRRAMTEALVTEGLTPSEAAAMVETWRDLWFGETGTRLLAIMPQPWVARSVPLRIEPVPSSLARVYVARLEILTRAREEALLAVLTGRSSPELASPHLKALDLGRFTQGALKRAKELQSRKLDTRFYEVSAAK